jgi:hypothetical protein
VPGIAHAPAHHEERLALGPVRVVAAQNATPTEAMTRSSYEVGLPSR